jgi:ubiquinone/menaquinone biosynthesis C-methylase UbiE
VPKNDFTSSSYKRNELHFKAYARGGPKEEMAKSWLNADTVDSWRHQHMYGSIDPLLLSYPEAKWLTVGDGRYGNDAHYIQQKGLSALATDISDFLLKEAKEIGYVTDWRKENAESLSFSDEEFDFVLCKESYHHFPRPMVALYEMIRVAKKGVILIEPHDSEIISPGKIRLFFSYMLFTRFFIKFVERFLGKEIYSIFGGYEPAGGGNYVFTISEREIEKVALGLNLEVVAFKGLNDCYIEGVEYEKLHEKSELYRKVKTSIKKADIRCKFGIQCYGLLVAIIFKESPQDECIKALKNNNFKVVELPKNPGVTES